MTTRRDAEREASLRIPELLAAIADAKQTHARQQQAINRLIIELEDYIARHAEPRVTEARRSDRD
jgi:hypothetical protein